MRRAAPLLVALALIAGLLPAAITSAAPPDFAALAGCATYADQRICSGEVPSFDGTPLDVDLTFPIDATGDRHPLMVLLHGFGNDKHEWESTTDQADNGNKWHWNSHWFAEHGFYVLTYTARGFRSQPPRADEPATPAGTSESLPNGTIHLKSREFEVRDTQWLAALAAGALPNLDAQRIAVSGGSYGGGESWLLASQADWTFPHSIVPVLPVLSLQVAVPKYPWTDLAYSLLPNGHGGGPDDHDIYESSQGQPDTGLGNPIGVAKESYADALFAIGTSSGVFEEGTTTTPSSEGPINLTAWFNRMVTVGDPYPDVDPIVAQVRRGLTLFRGSYYQLNDWASQVGQREVAVFSISGWNDDLFPPVESFRQFKELKRLDPLWPVELAVADVGHPRAQNRPEVWRELNTQAWQFLNTHINGSHREQTTVISLPTVCPPATAQTRLVLSATTPEGLSNGRLTVAYAGAATLNSAAGAADPNGPAADPLAHALPLPEPGGACTTSPGPVVPPIGFTAISQALPLPRTFIGLGYVDVPYVFTGQTGQLDARVWDVAPDGTSLLMSRGTYRLDVPAYDAPAGTLRLPLFGNHWSLDVGHSIRLDLTQVDQPYLRPSNPPSSITFGPPRLVLPTREATDLTLAGQ